MMSLLSIKNAMLSYLTVVKARSSERIFNLDDRRRISADLES